MSKKKRQSSIQQKLSSLSCNGNEIAEIAKNQLRLLSQEQEDIDVRLQSYNYLQKNGKHINGWTQTEAVQELPEVQKHFQIKTRTFRKRNCRTNNDYMSFRECEKFENFVNSEIKNLEEASSCKKASKNKTSLKLNNIIPFVKLQTISEAQKIVNKSGKSGLKVLAKKICRNNLTEQNLQDEPNTTKRAQSKQSIHNFNFSTQILEHENSLNKEVTPTYNYLRIKKKCLKSNNPNYFNHRSSIQQECQFLMTRQSPRCFQNFVEKFDSTPHTAEKTIHDEFVLLLKSQTKQKKSKLKQRLQNNVHQFQPKLLNKQKIKYQKFREKLHKKISRQKK